MSVFKIVGDCDMLLKVNTWVFEVVQGTLSRIELPAGKASADLQCLPLPEKEERPSVRTVWDSAHGPTLPPLSSQHTNFCRIHGTLRHLDLYFHYPGHKASLLWAMVWL